MKWAALALILTTLACGSRPDAPLDGGYTLKAENRHPDDVVVYLYNGSRRRLGRIIGPSGTRTWHLSSSEVQSGPVVIVCVGNFTPNNRQCHTTERMTGGYAGEWGQPGKVFVVIQRGLGGIVALLNG